MATITELEAIESLAADIRELDGSHELGAGALAEALVAKGWTKLALAAPTVVLSLKDFKVGDSCETLNKNFDWVEGRVTLVDVAGTHIHTEKGPVTIQTVSKIRRPVPRV